MRDYAKQAFRSNNESDDKQIAIIYVIVGTL